VVVVEKKKVKEQQQLDKTTNDHQSRQMGSATKQQKTKC
jgi:hypothetical protein